MRRLVATLAAVAFVAIAAGASTGAGKDAADACPPGKVRVTHQGKESCQPHAAVFPRPVKGDLRLLALQALFEADWGAPPDAKGRRAPTLEALLGSFGPGAFAAAKQALPQILAMTDRLSPGKRLLQGVATAAASPCKGPGGPPKTERMTKDLGNGASFDLHTTVGDTITAGFGIQGPARDGSGRTVRWDIDFDMCDQDIAIGGPECPTAAGVLELSGKTNFTLTITTSKDGAVELAQKVKMAATVKLRGQTADDAKLDYVDVDATYRTEYSSGRQSILWGPSSERGTVVRKTRIDMRTGRYDPGQASAVDIQVSYSGVLSLFVQNAAAQARVAAELKKASDRQFARTISTTIEEYRERETKWQTPNTCSTMKLAPPSNTLRVKTGDTGRISGELEAKRGGKPTGQWRLVARQNLSVSPTTASVAEPAFDYRVTRGGARVRVSATFHATSKAGVARATWTQGGKDEELVPPRAWTGVVTYSGSSESGSSQSRATLKGTVTAAQIRGRKSWAYQAKSGTISWDTAGSDASCTWKANGSRPVTKWDLYMDIDISQYALRKDARAGFSAPDEIGKGKVTRTCLGKTTVSDEVMGNPFGCLATLVGMAQVDRSLKAIRGSKSDSYSSPNYKQRWTCSWSFKAVP